MRNGNDPMVVAVEHGLLTQRQADRLQGAVEDNDTQAYLDTAIPVCEDNELLFINLFMGMQIPPFLARRWAEIKRYPKKLIRMPRQTGKTSLFTTGLIIHRFCYASVPRSIHEDGRALVLLETKERIADRLKPIKQIIKGGGPGHLIGTAFKAPDGRPLHAWANEDGSWDANSISFPHPRGFLRPDPVIRFLAPGMGTVGFAPKDVLGDDIVGTRSAGSEKKRQNLSNWFGQDVEPMFKPYTRFWGSHTVFHPEDINAELASSGSYRLIEEKGLNRMPRHEDYERVYDDEGMVTDIRINPSGRDLVSVWGCPTHDEEECPLTEAHMAEVGYHRPVRDLLMQHARNPNRFALQYMHIIRRTDQASVKPWMIRFFVKDPDDPRIGKVANKHVDWSEWRENNPAAGLQSDAPTVVCFNSSGQVIEEKGGPVVTRVERSIHGWDLAIGKKTTNDRTVCCRCYRTTDKRYFNIFEKGRWRHDQVWRMMVNLATTDPVRPADDVAIEVNNFQEIYRHEVLKLMRKMNAHDRFTVSEVRRVSDKDVTFMKSGLPITMSNGFWFMDLDDDDAYDEITSVTPDQTGGRDDVLDGAVNAYLRARHTAKIMPGMMGGS
jgi:hypothetical protein